MKEDPDMTNRIWKNIIFFYLTVYRNLNHHNTWEIIFKDTSVGCFSYFHAVTEKSQCIHCRSVLCFTSLAYSCLTTHWTWPHLWEWHKPCPSALTGFIFMVFTTASVTPAAWAERSTTLRCVESLRFHHHTAITEEHARQTLWRKKYWVQLQRRRLFCWCDLVWHIILWTTEKSDVAEEQVESSSPQTDHTMEEQQVNEKMNWVRRVGFHWKIPQNELNRCKELVTFRLVFVSEWLRIQNTC